MTPPHLQTHKAGLLKGPFPQVQGKAPTKPSAPETTKRGCSAQHSPHARSLDTRLSPGGGSGVSASPWREGGGWTEPHQPEAAGWAVGGRRKVTHLSSLGWSRRCRRSLTTDFLSKAFSQCFPGGGCTRSSHQHLPGTPVLSSDPPACPRGAGSGFHGKSEGTEARPRLCRRPGGGGPDGGLAGVPATTQRAWLRLGLAQAHQGLQGCTSWAGTGERALGVVALACPNDGVLAGPRWAWEKRGLGVKPPWDPSQSPQEPGKPP